MCPVKTSTVTRLALPRSSPPAPPICRARRPDVQGFHHAKTMARDCLAISTTCTKRASLAPALRALLHSDDWLPQLFGSVQYFFVSTKSLSCFCRPWTVDRMGQKESHTHTKHNVTVAVAVSTVAVVVRQLIRGNAIARVVFVPWCTKKAPQ